MGFPRQEYCSGLPFPSPGDLPDPGIKAIALAGGFFATEPPGEPVFFFFFKHTRIQFYSLREREVNRTEDFILPLTPLSDL